MDEKIQEPKSPQTIAVATCPICKQMYFGTTLDLRHECETPTVGEEME
jgi:hypothetical protein